MEERSTTASDTGLQHANASDAIYLGRWHSGEVVQGELGARLTSSWPSRARVTVIRGPVLPPWQVGVCERGQCCPALPWRVALSSVAGLSAALG